MRSVRSPTRSQISDFLLFVSCLLFWRGGAGGGGGDGTPLEENGHRRLGFSNFQKFEPRAYAQRATYVATLRRRVDLDKNHRSQPSFSRHVSVPHVSYCSCATASYVSLHTFTATARLLYICVVVGLQRNGKRFPDKNSSKRQIRVQHSSRLPQALPAGPKVLVRTCSGWWCDSVLHLFGSIIM